MKLFKQYKLILIILAVFTIFSTGFYFLIPNIDITSFYTGFATIIVGCFAIYLYIKQKIDQKSDAANVILAEIRYAEKLIDQFKSSGITLDSQYQILPTNNWNKHSYLFINDLDYDEIAEINNFYNQCFILDRALDQMSVAYELKHKSEAIHNGLSLIAKESLGNKEIFKANATNFIKLIDPFNYIFRPNAPINSITKTLDNVRFVTTSTSGAKLKKIADLN